MSDAMQLVENGFLTIPEASRFLRVSRSSVYNLCRSGALRFAKFGDSRRIPLDAVKQYAAGQLVAAGGEVATNG
jgi:excisionase family DNA binding protein